MNWARFPGRELLGSSVVALIFQSGVSFAGTLTKSNTFSSGSVISSSQINQNFDEIVSELNTKDSRIATLETQVAAAAVVTPFIRVFDNPTANNTATNAFTVPTGITKLSVEIYGGGGGGGGAAWDPMQNAYELRDEWGGFGGEGGRGLLTVTAGQSVSVFVGRGGVGGSNNEAGDCNDASSPGESGLPSLLKVNNVTQMVAAGGAGGTGKGDGAGNCYLWVEADMTDSGVSAGLLVSSGSATNAGSSARGGLGGGLDDNGVLQISTVGANGIVIIMGFP